jgi:hypothetical protein
MDLKDLGVLGGAVSAVIAAISYWAKTRHERRRATRTALYYLLEAHHLVRRINFATNHFLNELRAAFVAGGVAITDAELTSVTEQMTPLMRGFMQAPLEELSTEIRAPFATALADLAKEDPVLAFELRGRDKLLLLSQNIDAMVSQALTQAVEIGDGERSATRSNFDAFLLDTAASELESAIRSTAWKCDLVTHIRVKLLLTRTARNEVGKLREFVADMVKKLVSTVKVSPQ